MSEELAVEGAIITVVTAFVTTLDFQTKYYVVFEVALLLLWILYAVRVVALQVDKADKSRATLPYIGILVEIELIYIFLYVVTEIQLSNTLLLAILFCVIVISTVSTIILLDVIHLEQFLEKYSEKLQERGFFKEVGEMGEEMIEARNEGKDPSQFSNQFQIRNFLKLILIILGMMILVTSPAWVALSLTMPIDIAILLSTGLLLLKTLTWHLFSSYGGSTHEEMANTPLTIFSLILQVILIYVIL